VYIIFTLITLCDSSFLFPDGEFFVKNAVQKFVQDPKNPALLLNHDNEYLHYKDDWYIVDYEPDNFILVYYKGSNDAWDGYGGAFLYTRSPTLPTELVPRLNEAVARMKTPYQWSDFTVTDNSCPAQVENPTILRERFATRLLITEEQQLQEQLTAARTAALNTILAEEKEAEKSISFLEKEVEKFLGIPVDEAANSKDNGKEAQKK
jgi:violaxanthin de-epoxidase